MNISSQQKGTIVENRIVELISFSSEGSLTCYIPNADDDGLDIIVNRKGEINPIFLQVKSRFNLNKGKRFQQNVKISTFKEHPHLFYVFAYYNVDNMNIDCVWVVPSEEFKAKSITVSLKGVETFYRFNANPCSAVDKWSGYIVEHSKISERLIRQ